MQKIQSLDLDPQLFQTLDPDPDQHEMDAEPNSETLVLQFTISWMQEFYRSNIM